MKSRQFNISSPIRIFRSVPLSYSSVGESGIRDEGGEWKKLTSI